MKTAAAASKFAKSVKDKEDRHVSAIFGDKDRQNAMKVAETQDPNEADPVNKGTKQVTVDSDDEMWG